MVPSGKAALAAERRSPEVRGNVATRLEQALVLLDQEIRYPGSRAAIIGDRGAVDESSFVATRDGFLSLARALVRLVADFDKHRADQPDSGAEGPDCYWSAAVVDSLHCFPSFHEPSIVGAYVANTHGDFLAKSRELLGDTCTGWEADPELSDPAGDRS